MGLLLIIGHTGGRQVDFNKKTAEAHQRFQSQFDRAGDFKGARKVHAHTIDMEDIVILRPLGPTRLGHRHFGHAAAAAVARRRAHNDFATALF